VKIKHVQIGDRVKVHFTCRLEDDSIFDFSIGRDPIQFTIGEGQVIHGLEQAVIGMSSGEFKSIKVPADKAFGPHNRELIHMVSRDQFPKNLKPEIGLQLQIQQANGKISVVTVTDISESRITLDANHPLAGKNLIFDILLMGIADSNQINADGYDNLINALQQKEKLDDVIKRYQKNLQMSILISVPVFNRKKITQLSLAQTKRYKTSHCYLQVYNDHSTEYDNSFLMPCADEVIQLPKKMGTHNLRLYQFRKFLETDFDFIYMTDNDVIHDPQYINVLEILYKMGDRKLPVCIYNTIFHMQEGNILYHGNGIFLRKTAPGVSMFYDRKMVEKIVSMLDKIGNSHDDFGWDYRAIAYLDLPWITSETSYLEHYGGNGSHNYDYERDRALNPTKYLKEKRESILKYLTQDIELKIPF
jgi:peptidylprolyl isomerase